MGAARVFVITGPSGVGKGTLIHQLVRRVPGVELSISATTRPARPGELEGVDYHFLGAEEFERRVAADCFVEWAQYAGNRYGTLRTELQRRLAGGATVVLEIELHGARQVRARLPEAVQVFIAPPSRAVLRARLSARGTNTPEQIRRRLESADAELAAQAEFAYVVVNDRVDDAVGELVAIVERELAGA